MPARERGDDDRMDRDQDRDKDRDRDRDRDRERRRRSRSRDRGGERRSRRTRSKSRSPSHKRKRSPSASNSAVSTTGPSGKHEEPPMSQLTEEERQMKELLGFGAFHSTKGKKVEGNNVGGVHVIMKRKYRQYMNRKGGFNRPLDFVA